MQDEDVAAVLAIVVAAVAAVARVACLDSWFGDWIMVQKLALHASELQRTWKARDCPTTGTVHA